MPSIQLKTMDGTSVSLECARKTSREVEHEGQRSALKKQGSRPLLSASQSLRFDDTANLFEYEVEDLEPRDLPDIADDEERERVIKSAKELARKALEQDDTGDSQETCGGICFTCGTVPEDIVTGEGFELDEDTLERCSSKKLNQEIERRVSRELSRGESLVREDSKVMHVGVVSFGTFLSARRHSVSRDDVPRPLSSFLPPSPFFTFDGKLGVDCKAFRIDFTQGENIVPPFFLEGGVQDQRVSDVLKKGVSYAKNIDLFGPEDVAKAFEDEEPSAAHRDILAN